MTAAFSCHKPRTTAVVNCLRPRTPAAGSHGPRRTTAASCLQRRRPVSSFQVLTKLAVSCQLLRTAIASCQCHNKSGQMSRKGDVSCRMRTAGRKRRVAAARAAVISAWSGTATKNSSLSGQLLHANLKKIIRQLGKKVLHGLYGKGRAGHSLFISRFALRSFHIHESLWL